MSADLDAIRARRDLAVAQNVNANSPASAGMVIRRWMDSAADVPDLLAEVDRLTRERDNLAAENARVRQQRDALKAERNVSEDDVCRVMDILSQGDREIGTPTQMATWVMRDLAEARADAEQLRERIQADLDAARAEPAARGTCACGRATVVSERAGRIAALGALLSPAPSTPDGPHCRWTDHDLCSNRRLGCLLTEGHDGKHKPFFADGLP